MCETETWHSPPWVTGTLPDLKRIFVWILFCPNLSKTKLSEKLYWRKNQGNVNVVASNLPKVLCILQNRAKASANLSNFFRKTELSSASRHSSKSFIQIPHSIQNMCTQMPRKTYFIPLYCAVNLLKCFRSWKQ